MLRNSLFDSINPTLHLFQKHISSFISFRHILEFTLNGHVLPYNMTIYQAVRQYAKTNVSLTNQFVE